MSKKFKDDLDTIQTHLALLEPIHKALDIKTNAGRNAIVYALCNVLLLDRKQLDYGPRNISGFGVFGVTVRMNDKMERLKTLFNKGRRLKATNESIEDTFRDIANYAIIALMVERGEWPNE